MEEFKRRKVMINQIVVFLLTALTYAGITAFDASDIPGMAEQITLGVAGILEVIALFITQKQVTPVDDPRNEDGAPLVPDPAYIAE